MILCAENDDSGRRLDRILRRALPDLPLSALHRLLRKGQVLVNGHSAGAAMRISAGAVIELPLEETAIPAIAGAVREAVPSSRDKTKPCILLEGSGLLFINKPAGLAVHGGGAGDCLDRQVQAYLKGKLPPSLSFKPGPLHRLDKPSSGVIVFAYSLDAAKWFSDLLKEGKIRKSYLAILEGKLRQSEIWDDLLYRDKKERKTLRLASIEHHNPEHRDHGERRALTRIIPLAIAESQGRAYTYARLEIETGRTHQIRSQGAARGYPLAGDRKYGGHHLPMAHGRSYGSFFLHAEQLELPARGNIPPQIVKAPLPEAFSQAARELFGN
ncbi:MAG: RluA family pseudouridine synthase [Treponema sp.]|jgi:23S rRNA pseudouridine955/2504/2580 synthase|nr:RluA family pseudouridine synthase [Treponema sp.]